MPASPFHNETPTTCFSTFPVISVVFFHGVQQRLSSIAMLINSLTLKTQRRYTIQGILKIFSFVGVVDRPGRTSSSVYFSHLGKTYILKKLTHVMTIYGRAFLLFNNEFQ